MTECCKCGGVPRHEYGAWFKCDRCGAWSLLPMEYGRASLGTAPPMNFVESKARPHAGVWSDSNHER